MMQFEPFTAFQPHEAEAFMDDYLSANSFAETAKLPNCCAFVARGTGGASGANGAWLGHVLLRCATEEADVVTLFVRPEHRKNGLGNALLAVGMKAAKARGVNSVFLEVRVSNQPAKALYEKLGFQVVGQRPSYYTNPTEDAALYKKEL